MMLKAAAGKDTHTLRVAGNQRKPAMISPRWSELAQAFEGGRDPKGKNLFGDARSLRAKPESSPVSLELLR